MRARRGISLFEAIAALAIVAVTSVSALAAVGAEMRTAEKARRAIEIEALLTERVDYLSILTDRELQSLPDTVASGRFDAPFDEYEWTTSSSPSTLYPGLYDVEIALEWPGGSHRVVSAVYRRPPLATQRGQ
jgi:type II secretory pathway pseudopilin PulG